MLTPFPQQQFNLIDDRRSERPSLGVACLVCHINGHTDGATHLVQDGRPQEARHRVDTSRVYLTGISMGGHGAWALAMRIPKRLAALVPIWPEGSLRIDVPKSAKAPATTLTTHLFVPGATPVGQVDPLLTLKLTPNLGHCLSVYGIAREVSALTGAPLVSPSFPATCTASGPVMLPRNCRPPNSSPSA